MLKQLGFVGWLFASNASVAKGVAVQLWRGRVLRQRHSGDGKVMESCFLGTRCKKFLPILKAIGIQAKRENCHVPNNLKDELDIASLQLFLGKVSSHQRRSI